MPRYRDITGQKFGRLTAMHPTEPNRIGQMRWRFQCECGVEKIIVGANVVFGNVQSCGCLRRDANRNRQAALSAAAARANKKRPSRCVGIARELREARLAHGFTQEALAGAAGYDTKAIQKMEAGKSRPAFDLVADIAQALGLRLVLEK